MTGYLLCLNFENYQNIHTMPKAIKGKFVQRITVYDPETHEPVDLEIYHLETGGMVGIVSSYIQTEETIYSPFDKGVEINLDEGE
jgi:hypothetical protein